MSESLRRLADGSAGFLTRFLCTLLFCGGLLAMEAPHVHSAPPSHHRDADDDIEADDPANQEKFNRELWESIRKTPYARTKQYVALAQKAERARQRTQTGANTIVLPTGWKIAPAGNPVEVGRFPYEAVAFAGKIVVLNNGWYSGNDKPEVSVVDPVENNVARTLNFDSLFPSAAVGKDGDLYISGGFGKRVHRLNKSFETVQSYAIGGYAGAIAPIDATHIAVSYLVSADSDDDYQKGRLLPGRVAILNTQTGAVERETPVGYFPYALRFAGGKLYAALLGEDKVQVYDLKLQPVKTIPVGRAPMALCEAGGNLYVANSNSDSISVIDEKTDRVTATFDLRQVGTQHGGAPTSCVAEGGRLYVTLAYVNAAAALDLKTGHVLGYIPTGWYPTKTLVSGNRLFLLSAKGIHARRPNPNDSTNRHAYVLTLLKGALASVPLSEAVSRLATWTQQVKEGSPLFSPAAGLKRPIKHIFYFVRENRTYDQVFGDLPKANGDPNLTLFGREVTPNAHRFAEEFVTLDNYYTDAEISVLGHSFTSSGYASPFLEWLGNTSYSGRYKSYPYGSVPAVTSPTYLWDACDNKHVDYRVYGENYFLYTRGWSLLRQKFGAESPIAKRFYAQMMVLASKTDRGKAFYDFASSYYGQMGTPEAAFTLLGKPEFTGELSRFLCGDGTLAKALADYPDLRKSFAEYLYRYPSNYRSWDIAYSDLDRFQAWKTDFERLVQENKVPQLEYIWLPNDHTAGASSKVMRPEELVAQNDAALAFFVRTIAESPIWDDSLILVTEDDAQDGPDHVDATRTIGLAIGPSVRRGAVVHDRYDQLSLLRTIELILGLDPLNRNDALAVPMVGIFADTPDSGKPSAPVASSHLTGADKTRFEKAAGR